MPTIVILVGKATACFELTVSVFSGSTWRLPDNWLSTIYLKLFCFSSESQTTDNNNRKTYRLMRLPAGIHSLKMHPIFWIISRNSVHSDISRKSDRLPWIDSFHFLGSQSYTFSRPLALITMHKLSLSINGFPVLKFRHRYIHQVLG